MLRTEAEEVAQARSMMMRRVMSIIEDRGVYSSSCGYCKSGSRTSVAQGLWAHTLTVDDYQELLNRGWRRSGMFLYKPKTQQTCCPPHSIRLDVNAFTISKEQARVMRRMQRYLEGSYNGNRQSEDHDPGSSNASEAPHEDLDGTLAASRGKKGIPHDTPQSGPPCSAKKKRTSAEVEDEVAVQLAASIKGAITRCVESGSLPQDVDFPQVSVQKATEKTRDKVKGIEGQLDYTSSVAFAIAAALKRKRRKASLDMEVENSGSEVNRLLLQPPLSSSSSQQEFSASLVAELLVSHLRDSHAVSGFIPRACKGHLNFLTVGCRVEGNPPLSGTDSPVLSLATEGAAMKQASEDAGSEGKEFLPVSLPNGSHERELKHLPSSPLPLVKSRHIEIQVKESSFDPEEFALYKKYQVAVHNDRPEDINESSYCSFLVHTPLIYVAPENNGSTPSCGFGSFHQQYRIDGKLVAVGVVDILPQCLSSKYLFWDPDLAFLSLGKYSALREIQWVQEAHKVCPSLSYYYLGFYIHTCPKMRYKAAYAPSELLCPSKYTWIPYEQVLPALARSHFFCFSDLPTQNGSAATESVEIMESSEAENGNEEMSIDTTIVDAEYLSSNGEDPSSNSENGPPSPHPAENKDEKEKDQSGDLEKIILLLNSKLLTFKRVKEFLGAEPEYSEMLTEELTSYFHAVGPELASRMIFVPR